MLPSDNASAYIREALACRVHKQLHCRDTGIRQSVQLISQNPDMTEEKAREMMQQYFPTLKRWMK
ncbi:MAG: zinc ribbon domain-containing protein [[Clostridium] innocuum]